MLSDPLLDAALLIGLALLILLVALALIRRRRQEDSVPFGALVSVTPKDAVEASSTEADDAVEASSAESPDGPRPPTEDWTELVPPWADALESDLSDAFERRIDEVEDGLETRIDGVEDILLQAVEGIEEEVDSGFEEVEAKISAVSERTDGESRRREELEAEVLSRLDARQNGAGGGNASDREHSSAHSSDSGEPAEEMPSRVEDTLARARWNLARAFRSP